MLELPDLATAVDALRKADAHFRNDIVTGVGGKQILLEDPSGNPIELFQPKRSPKPPSRRPDSRAGRAAPASPTRWPNMRYSQAHRDDLRITPEPLDGRSLVRSSTATSASSAARFPGGPAEFDPARIAAPTTEFTPPDGVSCWRGSTDRPVGCGAAAHWTPSTGKSNACGSTRPWADAGSAASRLAALESAAAELGCHTVHSTPTHT